jgi:hypothetical protein
VNRCGRQGRLAEPPEIGQPGGFLYHRIFAAGPACGGRSFYETIAPAPFSEVIKFERNSGPIIRNGASPLSFLRQFCEWRKK